VNRHGGGAALLDSPQHIESIVAAVRRAVPAPMLVSAKMRLGVQDDSRAIDCAKAIEAGGASELVVHARTKLQGYQPPAHWHRVRDIRNAVRLRLIANGDIWTAHDAVQCRQISGCDDLMLGRGMVSNPGLARAVRGIETQSIESCRPSKSIAWTDLVPALEHLWSHNALLFSAVARAGRLKQWLLHLRRQFPEAQTLFQSIRAERDSAAISRAISESALLRPLDNASPEDKTPPPQNASA
jgi:tRNA-dihydrouridine synthase C